MDNTPSDLRVLNAALELEVANLRKAGAALEAELQRERVTNATVLRETLADVCCVEQEIADLRALYEKEVAELRVALHALEVDEASAAHLREVVDSQRTQLLAAWRMMQAMRELLGWSHGEVVDLA